jgi:hypothetical protein
MATNVTKIEKGWVAFVKDGVLIDIKEFKFGGSANTKLQIINKPTRDEVVAELTSKGIALTK